MKTSLSLFATLALATGAVLGTTAQTQAAPAKSALLGKWMMTMISATSYTNSTTGASSLGHGGAQIYEFYPNGHYKLYSYLTVGMYGQNTECFTWKEGNYSLSGNSITLRETSGKFQVKGSRNYSRPARGNDLLTETREWKVATENGKPVLQLKSKNSNEFVTFKKQ